MMQKLMMSHSTISSQMNDVDKAAIGILLLIGIPLVIGNILEAAIDWYEDHLKAKREKLLLELMREEEARERD